MVRLPVTARVIDKYVEMAVPFSEHGFVIVQHLLEDTEEFVGLLAQTEASIEGIIGIDYSANQSVLEGLRKKGNRVELPRLNQLGMVLAEVLRDAATERIIVHEVGGYFADMLRRQSHDVPDKCVGVVEETRQGLWRYRSVPNLPVPIVQVADGRLKRLEGQHVGDAVGRAIEGAAAPMLESLWRKRVAVIGFGDVGRGVAHSLRNRGAEVAIYDIDSVQRLSAYMEGFACPSKEDLLADAEVIVGATGRRCLSVEELGKVKTGALLVSASSRDIEFPLNELERADAPRSSTGETISEFVLESGRKVRVAAEGRPINFTGRSLPWSLSDLLFAQVMSGIGYLLSRQHDHEILPLPEGEEEEIAGNWLDVYAKPGWL